ncbi:winged helix-turn-helix domain-containing protein [Sphingomonas sp. ASY06-1R]|uniref:winged helix-turn-helix domain-containing protein n=1 Tax=Sphingomonas sp. ASY06-1R TaxID=3445771 RepID=UPI003FA26B1B
MDHNDLAFGFIAEVHDEAPSHAGSPETAPFSAAAIRIGALEILPTARIVRLDGGTVELGSRAYDVLMTLVEQRGQIVPKDVIMARVWPTTTVEEINLRVQLSCLRRALGEERWRIKTIPGRGYMLADDAPYQTDAPPLDNRNTAAQDSILIIEASAENRKLIQHMLARVGARVESFASLAEFLNNRQSPKVSPQGNRAPLPLALTDGCQC